MFVRSALLLTFFIYMEDDMSNELLKYAEKMNNPAVAIQSVLSLKKEEWASVYKTIEIVAKKLSEKIMPMGVTFIDLLDNKGKCPGKNGGEHELESSKLIDPTIEPECFMCVHCLEQFKKATNFTKTFFPGDT